MRGHKYNRQKNKRKIIIDKIRKNKKDNKNEKRMKKEGEKGKTTMMLLVITSSCLSSADIETSEQNFSRS